MRVARSRPEWQTRCQPAVYWRTAAAALLSVAGLAFATSVRGFSGLVPSAALRFSGGRRTVCRSTVLGGGLRWEDKVPKGQDPLFSFKTYDEPDAPVPWDRSQTEVMVDAMSVIKWYWEKIQEDNEDLTVLNDISVGWPQRVFQAAMVLTEHYGKDRPPSPWRPVIVVFDQPDKEMTWSGLKIKKWSRLQRSGPLDCGLIDRGRYDTKWESNGKFKHLYPQIPREEEPMVTLAWAQTYVDQSAAGFTRCDREILYMLEVITRQFARRQVLVTEDRNLAEEASRYCTVRGAEWFEREVLALAGERGPDIIEALMGGSYGIEKVTKVLPRTVRAAFLAQ